MEILNKINNILNSKNKFLEEIGYVFKVYDGIAIITGLEKVKFNEVVEFKNGTKGIVFNIEKEKIGVVILGEDKDINSGEKVKRTYNFLKIPVGKCLLGRVIDTLGRKLDNKKRIISKIEKKVETKSPSILDRESVNQPLQTGIKIIDSLIPIGKGQRELIIGDRQTGKTSIAIDIILNQCQINETIKDENKKVYSIYVAIGQKNSFVNKIIKKLKDKKAIKYTVIVIASAANPVSLQFYAPYVGCTIAEYFRDNGMHSLIIYDDLSKHAIAYRQMSLLLKRSPGREAYPGDIFYIHARLLERAANLKKSIGGGSLTAIPIIETQNGDLASYIATNVISITDGQIFLESDLFKNGIKPAINIGLSVSRIGSAAQTEIVKKISSKIKLELAQYREMESFTKFGTELDINTRKMLKKGEKMISMFKQNNDNPLSLEELVVHLFGTTRGYLEKIKNDEVNDFLKKIFNHIKYNNQKVLEKIKLKKKLTKEIEIELTHCFNNYKIVNK